MTWQTDGDFNVISIFRCNFNDVCLLSGQLAIERLLMVHSPSFYRGLPVVCPWSARGLPVVCPTVKRNTCIRRLTLCVRVTERTFSIWWSSTWHWICDNFTLCSKFHVAVLLPPVLLQRIPCVRWWLLVFAIKDKRIGWMRGKLCGMLTFRHLAMSLW